MLFFLAAVALTIFYHSYMHYLADIKMESTLIQSNLAGNFQAWKTNQFYDTLLTRSKTAIFTNLGLTLAVFGLFLSRKNAFFHIWLISMIFYIFLVAIGNQAHSYYQMPLIPVGSFFIGLSLYRLYQIRSLRIMPFLLCMVLLYQSMVYLMPMYSMYAYVCLPCIRSGDKAEGHRCLKFIDSCRPLQK